MNIRTCDFAEIVLQSEKASERGRKFSRIMLRDALAAIAAADRNVTDKPLRDFARKYADSLVAPTGDAR